MPRDHAFHWESLSVENTSAYARVYVSAFAIDDSTFNTNVYKFINFIWVLPCYLRLTHCISISLMQFGISFCWIFGISIVSAGYIYTGKSESQLTSLGSVWIDFVDFVQSIQE